MISILFLRLTLVLVFNPERLCLDLEGLTSDARSWVLPRELDEDKLEVLPFCPDAAKLVPLLLALKLVELPCKKKCFQNVRGEW